jgi:hypothetical protein
MKPTKSGCVILTLKEANVCVLLATVGAYMLHLTRTIRETDTTDPLYPSMVAVHLETAIAAAELERKFI